MIKISGQWYYQENPEQVVEIQTRCENFWYSLDGKKYFQYEHNFINPKESGIFINAQEFELISENTLRQKLMGYRFDPASEQWIHFERTDILKHKEIWI